MYKSNNKLAEIDPSQIKRLLVFGDIHGDYGALERGLAEIAEGDLTIFLGDYADRGPNGVEVIGKVHECIREKPDRFIGIKGNHEDYLETGEPVFSPWTLIDDVRRAGKSWENYFTEFLSFVDKLYLAAVLPGFALFVHGGVSSIINSLGDLSHPDRNIEEVLLWSDPDETAGEKMNPRGAGCLFGPDITEQVLSRFGVEMIIRGHQPRKASKGPAVEQGGKVVTTNCTDVYGGRPFILCLDMQHLPKTEDELQAAAVFL